MAQPGPEQVAAYVEDALDRAGPPDAVAAHRFGSCPDGAVRLDSDTDTGIIAVRSVWSRPEWVPWHPEARVARVLRGLRGHAFHVSVLSPRQVRFCFRLVATGRRVWARDPDAADDFVEFIARRDPDEAYRYRQSEADLIQALRQD
jgi:predicted nucleotidyltransferase